MKITNYQDLEKYILKKIGACCTLKRLRQRMLEMHVLVEEYTESLPKGIEVED